MHFKSLLLSAILTLAAVARTQTQSAPAPPVKDGPGQMDMEHHGKMSENHKQQRKAMKATRTSRSPLVRPQRSLHYAADCRRPGALLLACIPNVQEIGVACSGNIALTFINGPIQRRPHVFLAIRQFRQGYFERSPLG